MLKYQYIFGPDPVEYFIFPNINIFYYNIHFVDSPRKYILLYYTIVILSIDFAGPRSAVLALGLRRSRANTADRGPVVVHSG